MKGSISFDDIVSQCVRVDWKTPMEETLAAMRWDWGERYDFLLQESLDKLAENQAGESPTDQFLALGQEMTVYGFSLHAVDEGSDEYCLVLIPLEETEAFAAWLKKTGRSTELLKQPRKKKGSPATRIKVADRLIVDTFDLAAPDTFASLEFPGQNFALLTRRHYSEGGAHTHDTCAWLDCAAWPPVEHLSEHVFGRMAFSPEHSLWAFAYKTGHQEGELWVTDSPVSPTFSRRIPFPETPGWREKRAADPAWAYYNADIFRPLSSLCWMGDDLFVSYDLRIEPPVPITTQVHVWVARGAAKGEAACEKLFVTPPLTRLGAEHSHVATTGDGQQLIMFGGWFYAWEGGALRETGLECETRGLTSVATGAHRFAYVTDRGKLLEHDITSGKSRHRSLPGMYPNLTAVRLTPTVTAFHPWGRLTSDYDLALIWDMERDEWLRLRYGALGKESPTDMLALSETEWLLKGEEKLYRVRDLTGQLMRNKRNILEPPVWSEIWPVEGEDSPEQNILPMVNKDDAKSAPAPDSPIAAPKEAPAPSGGLFRKICSLFR